MPNIDGTGPRGFGQLTGRGRGYCRKENFEFGQGNGRGFGFRRQTQITKEEEKEILERSLKEIEIEKEEIQKRLKEI